MLRFFLTVLLLLAAGPVCAGELLRQELDVQLDPAAQTIDVTATLAPLASAGELPRQFRLNRQARIQSVQLDGTEADFQFDNGRISLPADRVFSRMRLHYRIRFDQQPPEDSVGIEDPTFGVQGTITERGTFLSGASRWHPLPPSGAKSLFKISVTGPAGLVGVAGGKLLDTGSDGDCTTTSWQSAIARKDLSLAAGRYIIGRDRLGDIEILTFFRRDNSGLAPGYLAACRKYLRIYRELFGPYPYPTYAVVENFFPTGYGLPGWTLLGSSVIKLPFILYTSLPHEIVHAWWGNAIEVDYDRGNWSEGLATYLADYYLKELRPGRAALEYRRKILRDYATLAGNGDFALNSFKSRRSKTDQAVGYGKAAMVFHMLRRRIGDQPFREALRQTARSGLGKAYSWSDLRKHFEQASRTELNTFFDQWIRRPGAPVIALAWVARSKTATGWQVTGTLTQQAPAYQLRLPLRITTAQGPVDFFVDTGGEATDFSLELPGEPERIEVDPANHVFRMLYPAEIPRTINHLRAASSPLVVVATGAEELAAQSQDLLKGLQWHAAEIIEEAELDQQRLAAHDILFIGRPATIPFPETLPDSVVTGRDHFSIDGQPFANRGDALFLVLEADHDRKTRAYYLPNSAEAARDNARRISHYGRYSYLVFSNGHNRIKATWEPADSPLARNFPKGASR